jgi:hypothetical protein
VRIVVLGDGHHSGDGEPFDAHPPANQRYQADDRATLLDAEDERRGLIVEMIADERFRPFE